MSAFLSVNGLQASYGHAQALFDISFEVAAGEVITVLGRNGMGRSTTVPAASFTLRFTSRTSSSAAVRRGPNQMSLTTAVARSVIAAMPTSPARSAGMTSVRMLFLSVSADAPPITGIWRTGATEAGTAVGGVVVHSGSATRGPSGN